MPDDQHLPLSSEDIRGSLHGASEVVFHRSPPSGFQTGLTKLYVLPRSLIESYVFVRSFRR
jgi:hypothetical protein